MDRSVYASVAQPVVQLIRNQQVACSSHVTSSSSPQAIQYLWRVFRFTAKRIAYDLCCFLLSPKGTLCVSARLQDPQNGFPLLPLFRGVLFGEAFFEAREYQV